jgi:hypothetical protein
MSFVVHLTNGDELRYDERHCWSQHASGALEIMDANFVFVMLIAPHEWKLVKRIPPTVAP